ncbi:hypothetical protein KIN20_018001 [Parelaphostrongylus tenuis]|uniref:Uncharacterized protein n=1 Tax=Parelaphostrongylus tenuis TaxID=148309 RepID=A0AAD5QR70_PARTN|nr:hypothetical protein KIN20_018001 [Parelaphostrongylus tenuis]
MASDRDRKAEELFNFSLLHQILDQAVNHAQRHNDDDNDNDNSDVPVPLTSHTFFGCPASTIPPHFIFQAFRSIRTIDYHILITGLMLS